MDIRGFFSKFGALWSGLVLFAFSIHCLWYMWPHIILRPVPVTDIFILPAQETEIITCFVFGLALALCGYIAMREYGEETRMRELSRSIAAITTGYVAASWILHYPTIMQEPVFIFAVIAYAFFAFRFIYLFASLLAEMLIAWKIRKIAG
ncbi:MAG: hypothetical protein HGA31_06435 [Candidatus Moranbacteria bacterium]|nr:hypothetical protein [Candidatus Moranbacteria bacterium]